MEHGVNVTVTWTEPMASHRVPPGSNKELFTKVHSIGVWGGTTAPMGIIIEHHDDTEHFPTGTFEHIEIEP
jgi:hypothetical protein